MLAFRMLQSGSRPGEYLLTIGSDGTARGYNSTLSFGGLSPSYFEGNSVAGATVASNAANNFYFSVSGDFTGVSCRLTVPGLTTGVNASAIFDEKSAGTQWVFSVPGAYAYLDARVGTTIPLSFRRS